MKPQVIFSMPRWSSMPWLSTQASREVPWWTWRALGTVEWWLLLAVTGCWLVKLIGNKVEPVTIIKVVVIKLIGEVDCCTCVAIQSVLMLMYRGLPFKWQTIDHPEVKHQRLDNCACLDSCPYFCMSAFLGRFLSSGSLGLSIGCSTSL